MTTENKLKPENLLQVARFTVETLLINKAMVLFDDSSLINFRNQRAGVFVTIYKEGQLRGCIGTINPSYENVIEETKYNAISSATRDPRFKPVQIEELSQLKYSVNILMPPEPIDATDKLDPQKYGVIVEASGNRRGLLLPKIESIKSVAEQVYHAMAKGGINPKEPIRLFRFETRETKED